MKELIFVALLSASCATSEVPQDECERNGDCPVGLWCHIGACIPLDINRICGDGLLGDDEVCDDGNQLAGDGCDPDCQRERGYECGGHDDCATGFCLGRCIESTPVVIQGDGPSFGTRISMTANRLVIGDPDALSCGAGCRGGAAYVYDYDGVEWTRSATLSPPWLHHDDGFGIDVAIDGDVAVVATVDPRCDATPGNEMDAGCPGAGGVHIFRYSGSDWQHEAYLKPGNIEAGDHFGGQRDALGSRVAISGERIVVGAPGEDSCATLVGGDGSDNSCDGAGATYVFTRSELGPWFETAYIKPPVMAAGDAWGSSVAVHGDILAAGAPFYDLCSEDPRCTDSGHAHVYRLFDGEWIHHERLFPSSVIESLHFGATLAFDGVLMAVGVPGSAVGDYERAGSARAYKVRHNGMTEHVTMSPRHPGTGYEFGGAVMPMGANVLAGAQHDASCAAGVNGEVDESETCDGSGVVYAKTRHKGRWYRTGVIKSADNPNGGAFGRALASDGDSFAVSSTAGVYVYNGYKALQE